MPEMQNAPRPLVEWANSLRPRANTITQELAQAIQSGQNPQQAVTDFNNKVEALKTEFVQNRASEYAAAKAVEQHPNFAAEHTSVCEWCARRSQNVSRTYNAPSDMNYFDLHLNEVSRYGDAHSSISIGPGEKSVSVNLNARSLRGSGQGRSRIEVSPKVTWEYDDPAAMASTEWEKPNDGVKATIFQQ